MSKFKHSTHALIEQTVKELLRPKIEPGKTYRLNGRGADGKAAIIERPVVSVDDKFVTYLRLGVQTKCQISTFQRMVEQHGIDEQV